MWGKLLVSVGLLRLLDVSAEDSFDDAVKKSIEELNIRGVSVAFKAPELAAPILRGYGKTASSDDSPDVTVDTAFMLASVSKVFAGAAVAVLLDQGILASLDDDICDVIPLEYNQSACRNPWFPNDPVTWRMIATHRSSLAPGIPEVVDESGQNVSASYGPSGGYIEYEPAAGNPTCPLTDVVGFYRDIMVDKDAETTVGREGLEVEGGGLLNWYDYVNDLDFGGAWYPDDQPGSFSDYSNFAIGYLAALVEHATGQPLNEFTQEHIFSKLGMNHTSWFREDLSADTEVAVPVHAIGNTSFEDVGHYCFVDYASGQLYTSSLDMALWAEAMLEKGVPYLWSNATSSHVFGCQEKDENGNMLDDRACEFALTWELLSNAKKQAWMSDILDSDDPFSNMLGPLLGLDWEEGVMHSGGEEGVQSQLIVLPSAGVYVFVVMNTSENNEDAAQILAQVVAEAAMDMVEKEETSTEMDDAATGDPDAAVSKKENEG